MMEGEEATSKLWEREVMSVAYTHLLTYLSVYWCSKVLNIVYTWETNVSGVDLLNAPKQTELRKVVP